MANFKHHALLQCLYTLKNCTNNPEIYLQPQPEMAEKFKEITETLYDQPMISKGLCGLKTKALPQLYVEDFDGEQIWQQVDLQNKSVLPLFSKAVSKIDINDVSFNVKRNPSSYNFINEFENGSSHEDYAFDDGNSDSSTDHEELKAEIATSKPPPAKRTRYATEVDDQFFKLSKMEEFLNLEDLKEGRDKEKESDEEIDLFEDIPSDDEGRNQKKLRTDVMYEDFFDPPESGEERIIDPKEFTSSKTAFEFEQEQMMKKIWDYETSMLEPLPWELSGEVSMIKRPENSLILIATDFDCVVKQDLVIDSDLTERLETIIKMAIKNKAWNDVERKVKPIEESRKYKKDVVLDRTKSKKGLAEVYEEDYLKQKHKSEEKENPKHSEIKKCMDELFPQLHALFSHIPKPVVIQQIKIKSVKK